MLRRRIGANTGQGLELHCNTNGVTLQTSDTTFILTMIV